MSNEPYCPYCKAQMFPHNYRTIVEFVEAWSCACLDIPGVKDAPPVNVCLARLLSLRVLGAPDYQFGKDRVPQTEIVKVGDRLKLPEKRDWIIEPDLLVKEVKLTQDAESWKAQITLVEILPSGGESEPWDVRMTEVQDENWMIVRSSE